MAKVSWNSLTEPKPDTKYVVAATRGLMIPWWNPVAIRTFLRYNTAINEQLNDNRDCLGYALRVTWFPPEGWTLSIWTYADAVLRFKDEYPHAEAMRALASQTRGHFRYIQWKSTSDGMPTQWEEVESQFGPKAQST